MNPENRLFILPGYSIKNKDWAEEIAKTLSSDFAPTIVYWPHWTSEVQDPEWIDKEVVKLKEKIGNRPVNLVTKSIGSFVAVKLLNDNPDLCEKLIICGLPLYDLSEEDKKFYSVLGSLPAGNILVIQNENDNHGAFRDVEEFVHRINTGINVVSRPRDDHEYPYPEEFKQFLKEAQ